MHAVIVSVIVTCKRRNFPSANIGVVRTATEIFSAAPCVLSPSIPTASNENILPSGASKIT
jgi:hypothetical protein